MNEYVDVVKGVDPNNSWIHVIILFSNESFGVYIEAIKEQKKAKKKKKRRLGQLKRVRFDIPQQRHPIMKQSIEYSNRANMYCFSSPKFQTVGRRV